MGPVLASVPRSTSRDAPLRPFQAGLSIQVEINKVIRTDSAADPLMPETNYHIYCFAEDDWPADAMGATIRSQSYSGNTAMPNKVSLNDVLNFSDSAAGEFAAALQLVHVNECLRQTDR